MAFVSTRASAVRPASGLASFETTVLSGYASDGGLFMPQHIPTITASDLAAWQSLSYVGLAKQILPLFLTNPADQAALPVAALHDILDACFAKFDNPENVLPVVPLMLPQNASTGGAPQQVLVAEMWHGPTGAFKDLALSLLGRLLEHYLSRTGEHRTIVVGTSGDTGSAAIDSVRGNTSVDIVVLFPEGRISRVQMLQMALVREPNVHVYAVDGSSDDLDVPIRNVLNDREFSARHRLCSINSVNWTRIMMQVVHFFFAYLRAVPASALAQLPEVSVVVPTGACGNIASGMLARQMGLPIKMVAAVNQNDIVHRALTTGVFSLAGNVVVSLAPSMDIQVPYNLERILYLASNRDHELVTKFWTQFEHTGSATIPEPLLASLRAGLSSHAANDNDVTDTIRQVYDSTNGSYVLDPHTAIGVHAVHAGRVRSSSPAIPVVCMATATPAKFSDSIVKIIGKPVPLPPSMRQALDRDDPSGTLANENNLDTALPEGTLRMRQGDDWEDMLRKRIVAIDERLAA
ncbi:threonine synthase-like protein [Capsaspora owczarzaki ATCC 30864]|uniref:Threonine synthase-like protein n=1 Tax=Capsaspora owczarzaki (strain ATCC 30864) TaxID=595528 RepID=A0A0D2X5Q6_CAPO3|nr:threonine synthase-like protein [Capsaspora owczarzaki ATCC 30864]KJE98224.1 threonine synthase-like protein [Capsaspora owczarzaki ATCC 30864]|eukprot:XP_004342475.2 threonine synthase-like protein [Capsaspora owczarzaki ATCC 30864]